MKSEPEEKEWFLILSNLFPDGEEQDETSPGTGDAAAPVLWAGILAASAAVIFLLIHAERKAAGKKKREQRKRD